MIIRGYYNNARDYKNAHYGLYANLALFFYHFDSLEVMTFIIVRCKDDEQLLFNPQSRIANLLSAIKDRYKIEHIDIGNLDLCDEGGIAKDLPLSMQKLASEFISPGTYVVVERKKVPIENNASEITAEDVTKGDEANRPMAIVYTTLLNNVEKLLPGFAPRNAVQKSTHPKDLRKGKRGKDAQERGLGTASPNLKSPSSMKANKNPKTARSKR